MECVYTDDDVIAFQDGLIFDNSFSSMPLSSDYMDIDKGLDFSWKSKKVAASEVEDFFKNAGLGELYILYLNSEKKPLNEEALLLGEETIPADNIEFYSGIGSEVLNGLPFYYDQDFQSARNNISFMVNADGIISFQYENYYKLISIEDDQSKLINKQDAQLKVEKIAKSYEAEFSPDVSLSGIELLYMPFRYQKSSSQAMDENPILECVPAYVFTYKYEGGTNPRKQNSDIPDYNKYCIDARTGEYFAPPLDPSIPTDK